MYRMIRYVVLIGCVGLFSNSISAANVVTTNLDNAIFHYRHGDFEKAIFQFRQIADQSNKKQAARANYLLGKIYERGDGVSIDDQAARSYYQNAAQLGHIEAQQRLQEFDGDSSIVQEWYMEAAWDGDVDAQYSLGYLYERGIGVEIDKVRAVQWLEEAAKNKHIDAQFRLGLLLISAIQEYRNLEKGKYWINKSAENGNEVAIEFVKQFFEKADDKKIIQIAGGLRTFEQTETDQMLHVIATHDESVPVVNAISADFSLKKNEKQAMKIKTEAVDMADQGAQSSLLDDEMIDSILLLESDESRTRVNHSIVNSNSAVKVNRSEENNLLVITAAVVLIILFLWWKQKNFEQKQDKFNALVAGKKQEITEADISTLLDHLMDNAAIPLAEAPVETTKKESNHVEEKVKSSAAKEEKPKETKHEPETQEMSQTNPVEKETPDTRSNLQSANKLSVDDFQPADTKDVVAPQSSETMLHYVEEILTAPVEEATLDEVVNFANHSQQSMTKFSQFLDWEADHPAAEEYQEVESFYKIGMMFVQGDGVAKNIKLGMRWLQKAADKGHQQALSELETISSEYAAEHYQKLLSDFG